MKNSIAKLSFLLGTIALFIIPAQAQIRPAIVNDNLGQNNQTIETLQQSLAITRSLGNRPERSPDESELGQGQ